jgi:hypothetical protein
MFKSVESAPSGAFFFVYISLAQAMRGICVAAK